MTKEKREKIIFKGSDLKVRMSVHLTEEKTSNSIFFDDAKSAILDATRKDWHNASGVQKFDGDVNCKNMLIMKTTVKGK